MFRLVGNEKAWIGFIITFLTALMAKFGLGDAPAPETLLASAEAALGPVFSGLLTHGAVWMSTNSKKGGTP